MKQWYRVHANKGTKGLDKPVFIFGGDTLSVYDTFKTINNMGQGYPERFPDIIPLSKEETLTLEEWIKLKNKINLSQAKMIGYNPSLLGEKLWLTSLYR